MIKKYTVITISKIGTYISQEAKYEYNVIKTNSIEITNAIAQEIYNKIKDAKIYAGRDIALIAEYKMWLREYNEIIDDDTRSEYIKNNTKAKLKQIENRFIKVKKEIDNLRTSAKIKKQLIEKPCHCIRVTNLDRYFINTKELSIIIFNENDQIIKASYLVGEIVKQYEEISKIEKLKIAEHRNKIANRRIKEIKYEFRKGPVPHTASWHKGNSSSKRGNGIHTRIADESIPEYKEYSSNKYRYIEWYAKPREYDKSWKSSCKVKKQYLKHNCKAKKLNNISKSKYKSIKEKFIDTRTTEEISLEILGNKVV